jgi:Fe2+ or Zn2+ uptake regulation protein
LHVGWRRLGGACGRLVVVSRPLRLQREAAPSPDAAARFGRLRARARERGLRLTPQRELLLQVLGRIAHHPTADELYRRVRKMLPTISPATVYRNAQVLVRAGVVGTLERAGSAVKYDGNPDDHHHFICTRCGSVADVYLSEVGYRLSDRRSRLTGAQIHRCEVQLHGLCARCAARAAGRGRARAGGTRAR